MFQSKMLGCVALLGLLAGASATADQRVYYRGSSGGHYGSDPQVRLGVDVVWGGHSYGYAPAPPPVVWYPSYYAPVRYYGPRYQQDYGWGHHKHHKQRRHAHHAHHAHHRDDCDD